MANAHEIRFVPNPVQRQFIESRAKADLYSSRMGEGKSVALSWSALTHTRHNPGARWAIIRDTWENLQGTTMKTFFEWFPPGVMGNWIASKREFVWASGIAEGSVIFLGMDAPDDASKLQSREFAGFAMDEPSPAVGSAGIDELIFDIAMSRLRQKGMNWYSAKLAENNPDETHWTYRKFVTPGIEGFRLWQPSRPENEQNLPPSYYAELRKMWAHRPDLIRRFVDGEFGFQSEGKAVTPQWNDKYHLSHGLIPIKGPELLLMWDFGHNPTAIISQKTPMGSWNILDAMVGDGIGAEELIVDSVLPLLRSRYAKMNIRHTGDPTGSTGDQSSIMRSPVRVIKKAIGGAWHPGPVRIAHRVEPLRSALTRMVGGKGLIQVDKNRAQAVHLALRGGWHYNVSRTGLVSGEPKKNMHSHPGDAISYGAAYYFPLSQFMKQSWSGAPREASYYEENAPWRIGPDVKNIIPPHGSKL